MKKHLGSRKADTKLIKAFINNHFHSSYFQCSAVRIHSLVTRVPPFQLVYDAYSSLLSSFTTSKPVLQCLLATVACFDRLLSNILVCVVCSYELNVLHYIHAKVEMHFLSSDTICMFNVGSIANIISPSITDICRRPTVAIKLAVCTCMGYRHYELLLCR